MRVRLLAAVAALLVLTGCMSGPSDGPSTVRRGSFVAQRVDPVEQRWHERDQLPSCGFIDVDQGQSIQQAGRERLACMNQALAAERGAEVTVRQLTIEGDPFFSHYRLTADGVLEAYQDSTRDRYSNPTSGWFFQVCTEQAQYDSRCGLPLDGAWEGMPGSELPVDPIQQRWQEHDPLPSCGSIILDQGESLRQRLDMSRGGGLPCLQKALRLGRPVELSVRFPTEEGHPIWQHHRLRADATLTTFTDSTADRYGTPGWRVRRCRPEQYQRCGLDLPDSPLLIIPGTLNSGRY